ncbi:MAG: hypothetical protein LBH20_09810 [Treponema sp.]|jgi:hypothetical protein|nr:hypothetical protein [Treponema sp.]
MREKKDFFTQVRKIRYGFLSLGVGLLVLSCASTPFKAIDSNTQQGDYQNALSMVEKDKQKLYSNNSQIVYYLDAGMLNHYMGEYDKSTELLQEGERAIEEAYTKSVSQGIASGLVNDNTKEYAGEDFEDIYINAFNALNYYSKGQLDSAVVEIRRMNEKLAYLGTKYQDLDKELAEQAQKDGVDPATLISKFANSALGRYLGILFHRADGNENGMDVEHRLLLAAFQNAPEIYSFPVPSTVEGELKIPAGKARLNIVGFSGVSPVKKEEVTRIYVDRDTKIKIALPILDMRPSVINRVEVILNGDKVNLEPIESIDAIYAETFKRTINGIRTKTIIRATTKAIAGAAMSKVGDNVGGTAGGILAVAGLFTKVATEISERADIRTSRFFPAKAWVTGITVDPGVHNITVRFCSGDTVIHQEEYELEAKAKGLNLVESFCLK